MREIEHRGERKELEAPKPPISVGSESPTVLEFLGRSRLEGRRR